MGAGTGTSLPEVAPQVIAGDDVLLRVVAAAGRAARIGVDLEASGMFTYRARACTLQMAWDDARELVVIDALALSIAPLADLLGPAGPVKIVHDVAFDARLLAEASITLANVHDTAVAARMLGRAATGLASLLESELGLRIAKHMQQNDWRIRPLDSSMLSYLATDVAHLEALDRRIWCEVMERGIEEEVTEETRYRLACAVAASRAPSAGPAYLRVKGVDRLAERELAVLRVVAELRETEACRRDEPPHRVASNDVLVAIARARPTTLPEVARIRGMRTTSAEDQYFAAEVVGGVRAAGESLPACEREWFERPRIPASVARERRHREGRLLAWRRAEAARRGVDEQVVLPGHCVKETIQAEISSVDQLSDVPGIGGFRVARDGAAIVRALLGESEPST